MKLEDNFTVSSITSKETYDWLLYKHYLKRIPSISFSFGLFDRSVLVGVVTYGTPASNSLCVGLCGKEYKSIVLELNRLCINDELPSNCASFFISRTFKLLPKPTILVSYADKSFGHTGYIYQATNWIYTGLSAKRTERYDILNPNKHSKTCVETMKVEDLAIRERPQKHRYIYFTGSKTQRKAWKKQLNYKEQPYPKGENKRYDSSHKVTVQQRLF